MKQSKGVHFYVTIDQAIVLQNRLWQMIAIVETKDTQILFNLQCPFKNNIALHE